MNSRWSADSSTNETIADRPAVSAASSASRGIVEPDRDLGGEVLEQVAGQAELGEHDEAGARGTRLGEQLVVAGEVVVEAPERRGDLGQRDAERCTAPV